MKLKGNWKNNVTYSVGDIVLFTDGVVYNLQKPCKAGITPIDTHYWGRCSAMQAICAKMVMDMEENDIQLENDLNQSTAGKKALDAHQGYVLNGLISTAAASIPTNISDEAITLKDSSDNEYLITVDGSGDTPELVVTAITPEVEEGAET